MERSKTEREKYEIKGNEVTEPFVIAQTKHENDVIRQNLFFVQSNLESTVDTLESNVCLYEKKNKTKQMGI